MAIDVQHDESEEVRDRKSALSSWIGTHRFSLLVVVALALVGVLVFTLLVVSGPEEVNQEPPAAQSSVTQSPTIEPDPDQDTDGDGLTDRQEREGWKGKSGEIYRTDPLKRDTDGDGLSDGEEAGSFELGEDGSKIDEIWSDPTRADTDNDGLNDGEEADASTNPKKRDTDNDGISDFVEINKHGTDPLSKDTDGDGLEDSYEIENAVDKGIDPQFPDVKISKWAYAKDFAKGAFAGEAMDSDSMAWFAGNIAMSSAGFIPVVGAIIGGIVDVRDLIISAIRGDWVGVGFSAFGLVPFYGDATTVWVRVEKFVTKFPDQKAAVGAHITKIPRFSEHWKIRALRTTYKEWDYLIEAGATPRGLLRLAENGRINLDTIAESMRRSGHANGTPTRYLPSGPAGEAELERTLTRAGANVDTQMSKATADCVEVCNASRRRIDVLAEGVAHESKVGYATLTDGLRRQIESDAYLVREGQLVAAHWHFYPSDVTGKVGPSKQLVELLEEKGIKYTIHLPK